MCLEEKKKDELLQATLPAHVKKTTQFLYNKEANLRQIHRQNQQLVRFVLVVI